MGFCSKGLKNGFETAVVNEPSVFEPLKFYCTLEVSILPSALPKFSKLIGQFIALSKKAGKEMHPANSTTCTGLLSIICSRTFLMASSNGAEIPLKVTADIEAQKMPSMKSVQ